LVEVRISKKKKSYFEAELIQILEPSPKRMTPPCPYFGRCGGCQLQHLAYETQLELKKEWLVEAFTRLAKIPVDFPVTISPAKSQWAYRRKVTLHGDPAGFYARDNQTIIPIKRCLIFSEKSLDGRSATLVRDSHDNFYESGKTLTETVDGLEIQYNAEVFTQNDPEQALTIYRDILAHVTTASLLDLYCGIGVLSLLAAASGKKVLGVELNDRAIQFAKKNAEKNGIKGVEFYARACEAIVDLPIREYETWLVNPPRTGLSDKVRAIVHEIAPKELIYMSCQPATLARDLKHFYEKGYKIKEARVYDMFAQTTHLETVVYLSK
jgi:23S rRNA (uracil1939-C5)-methyltransferase